MYNEPGDGLPGGAYTITFLPPDPTILGPDDFKRAKELNLGSNWGIPKKLMSSESSDMTVAVDEDLLDYEIRIKKARSQSGKLVNPNEVIGTAADQP